MTPQNLAHMNNNIICQKSLTVTVGTVMTSHLTILNFFYINF